MTPQEIYERDHAGAMRLARKRSGLSNREAEFVCDKLVEADAVIRGAVEAKEKAELRLASAREDLRGSENGLGTRMGRQFASALLSEHAENVRLREALKAAIGSADYVIRLCEDTLASGDSPNPHVRADWTGTVAHCYAAMSFVSSARAALSGSPATED